MLSCHLILADAEAPGGFPASKRAVGAAFQSVHGRPGPVDETLGVQCPGREPSDGTLAGEVRVKASRPSARRHQVRRLAEGHPHLERAVLPGVTPSPGRTSMRSRYRARTNCLPCGHPDVRGKGRVYPARRRPGRQIRLTDCDTDLSSSAGRSCRTVRCSPPTFAISTLLRKA